MRVGIGWCRCVRRGRIRICGLKETQKMAENKGVGVLK